MKEIYYCGGCVCPQEIKQEDIVEVVIVVNGEKTHERGYYCATCENLNLFNIIIFTALEKKDQ